MLLIFFYFRGIPLTTTALLLNMSVIQYNSMNLLRNLTYLKVVSLSLTSSSRERIHFSFNPLKRSGSFRYYQVEH